ncbi:hypothetical protein BGZ94_003434 [Podila epigama]|nr:hypothetical protein BGZ94_003434 [Podila epigama]
MGRSLIVNALILSKLWHVIRVHPPTQVWLNSLASVIRKFVMPFSPSPSLQTAELPRDKGGLGLINATTQGHALRLRFVQHLALDSRSAGKVIIVNLLQYLTNSTHWTQVFLEPTKAAHNDALIGHSTLRRLLQSVGKVVSGNHLPRLRSHTSPHQLLSALNGITFKVERKRIKMPAMTTRTWRATLTVYTPTELMQAPPAFWQSFWKAKTIPRGKTVMW